MRRPRVRFTVRGLMIAVAIAALVFGVGVTWRRLSLRAQDYRARANSYAAKAVLAEAQADLTEAQAVEKAIRAQAKDVHRYAADPTFREQVTRLERLAAHYLALSRKYRQAAEHPWRPVAPDPPEPR